MAEDEASKVWGRLGDVILHRKIAEGAMSSVFAGHSDKLGRDVAVKVLSKSRIRQSPGFDERFNREAVLASRLFHPNVVRVLYNGDEKGQRYLVMELLDEESLEDKVLKAGALPADQVAAIGRSVAGALDYAHSTYGIIHRDIKPAHLLFDQGGRVKIIDLGLAKSLDEDLPVEDNVRTMQGTALGTPNFMPPEQVRDGAGVDLRADIYSLGATLFYAVSGRKPFGEGSAFEILPKVVEGDRPSLEQIAPSAPEWLVGAIEQMMQPDPNKRFQDYTSVIRALRPPGKRSITKGFDESETRTPAPKAPQISDIPEVPEVPEIPEVPEVPEPGAPATAAPQAPPAARTTLASTPSSTTKAKPPVARRRAHAPYALEVLIVVGGLLFVMGFAVGVTAAVIFDWGR